MSTPVVTLATPSDLSRRILGLLNLYRLLIPPTMLTIWQFSAPDATVGQAAPTLFLVVCALYLVAGILLVLALRLRSVPLRAVAITHGVVDALGIAALMYVSGGVTSGLGVLLALPVAATALLAEPRTAAFIAAFTSVAVLVQQVSADVFGAATAADYTTAGVLGAILFLVAFGVWPVANRLRENEALLRRQEVDLANLAQLSQYIVQHLRESILVIDEEDRIRLINESAAQILGDRAAFPGALLGEASPRLLYLLSTWRQHGAEPSPEAASTFVAADGAREIAPHFAPLGSAEGSPVLVFLEDTSELATRVQQSKLASLGRLSASIAHEIRNPVGAMSHAAQLLQESPALNEADRRLTEIITKNGERVSAIISNVLSMSRRDSRRPELVRMESWLATFTEEFCATMQLDPARLVVLRQDADIEIRVDASQLRQVVWNLCENALRHGRAPDGAADAPIELRFGRLKPSARPYLEVADRGPGIPPEHVERIFEPFFSGHQRGSGLGLFLARELAQSNSATLLYEARAGGGTVFRLVFSDPNRWE
jgi:two-component system sensor histidine kinase PilS (NtrC family)